VARTGRSCQPSCRHLLIGNHDQTIVVLLQKARERPGGASEEDANVKAAVTACAALALIFALTYPLVVVAKGPVDRLTIEGPGLAQPVEITDPAELADWSPWTRTFIAWSLGVAAVPPATKKSYTVSFYDEGTKMYVLEYVPGPSEGTGLLYIPGPEHPAYRLNIGTIITGDSDWWNPNGKWHHATNEWAGMIDRALKASSPQPATGPTTPIWIAAGVGMALAGVIVVLLWRSRRTHGDGGGHIHDRHATPP
jgi:hypothetical protein